MKFLIRICSFIWLFWAKWKFNNCLVREAHRCEQLAQGCYAALPRVNYSATNSLTNHYGHYKSQDICETNFQHIVVPWYNPFHASCSLGNLPAVSPTSMTLNRFLRYSFVAYFHVHRCEIEVSWVLLVRVMMSWPCLSVLIDVKV